MATHILLRIARSILRDLIIPWIISAVFIISIGALIWMFGLWVWPAGFMVFLLLCKARRDGEQADRAGQASD